MTYEETTHISRDTPKVLTLKQDEQLDHIVDTTGCSYDDAMRQMGLPVDDPTELRVEVSTTKKPTKNRRNIGGQAIRGVLCGDCLTNIPPGGSCAHIRVGRRNGRYASDDTRY